jgi:ATP adenylyltransferase
MSYIQKPKKDTGCVFCSALSQVDGEENLIVWRGEHAFLILNRYPYNSGHVMVVPLVHRPSLGELEAAARAEIMEITTRVLDVLAAEYHPQGFNLGINIGEIAGAGIANHVHMHIVPRWGGDTNFMSTVGGARVLPEALEATYWRIRNQWEKQ